MRFPPQWVFEIWKQRKRRVTNDVLSLCGTEADTLKKIVKEVGEQFTDIDWLYSKLGYWSDAPRGSPHSAPRSPAELIVCFAWAIYIEEDDGVLNEDTKFPFASFLKAGAGHILTAHDLLHDGDWRNYMRHDNVVSYIGDLYGFVNYNKYGYLTKK
jgi:hypothetical protein